MFNRQICILIISSLLFIGAFGNQHQGRPSDNYIRVGALGLMVPKFPGISSYRFIPVPSLDMLYQGMFYLSAYKGAGIQLQLNDRMLIGGGVRYIFGGRSQRSKYFQGLTDTRYLLEGLLFAKYRLGDFKFKLKLAQSINRLNNGGYVDLGFSYQLHRSEQFLIKLGPTLTFGSNNYMETLYGINAAQAAASGLTIYKPNGGLESIRLNAHAFYFFYPNWSAHLFGNVRYFSSIPRGAGIIKNRVNFFAGLGIHYQFNL